MFRNYIKIAIRNITRFKLYSFLNILSLVIGLTSFILIFLWVQDELSYDQFHSKSDRIFRVEQEISFEEFSGRSPLTSRAYGPTLVNEYPDIINYVRLNKVTMTLKDYRNSSVQYIAYGTDNSIFDVFDFNLLEGNKASALKEPNTIVLTREKALQILGKEEVIGESVSIEWDNQFIDFKITGILEDVPVNSHVHFDILYSRSTIFTSEPRDGFDGNYLYTYVLLKEGIDKVKLESKFSRFMNTYRKPHLRDLIQGDFNIDDILLLKLKSITDIHLNPCLEFEIEPQGNKTSVYFLSLIAFLIIFIACINFVNLSVAKSRKRAKEVGLRKTLGAFRGQLRNQFISESMMMTVLAFCVSLIAVLVFLPMFNFFSGKEIVFNAIFEAKNIIGLIIITLLTGLVAGFYPAIYLAAFSPTKVIKGNNEGSKRNSGFRTAMVIVQFVISISLIIGTFIILDQVKFIQSKSLGFDKENIVLIPVSSSEIVKKYEEFKNKLLVYPQIKSISVASNAYGDTNYDDTGFLLDNSNKRILMTCMRIGYDYLDTYKMDIVKGRKFSRDYGTDKDDAIIINEEASKKIGLSNEEIIGHKLNGKTVIGVVKDFNFRSLHQEIEPLVLILNPKYIRSISIRLDKTATLNTLEQIEGKWKETYAGIEFDFNFLDEKINLLYHNEVRMKNIFLIFSLLSIVVACLGLFGLSSLIAEERTKEVGIRKVIGASVRSILMLLLKDFSTWLLIANVVAWPVAYILLSKWLQNFVYRIELNIIPFILGSLLVFTIASLTASFQSLRAALANPVDSLRNE